MRRAKDKKKKKRIIPTPRRMGGKSSKLSGKARRMLGTLPRLRLSNLDLIKLAKSNKFPHFRGVFMIDEFPKKPWKNERAIFNLDSSVGSGSHWVCYKKRGEYIQFFDSSGANPPSEFVRYVKSSRISWNRKVV